MRASSSSAVHRLVARRACRRSRSRSGMASLPNSIDGCERKSARARSRPGARRVRGETRSSVAWSRNVVSRANQSQTEVSARGARRPTRRPWSPSAARSRAAVGWGRRRARAGSRSRCRRRSGSARGRGRGRRWSWSSPVPRGRRRRAARRRRRATSRYRASSDAVGPHAASSTPFTNRTRSSWPFGIAIAYGSLSSGWPRRRVSRLLLLGLEAREDGVVARDRVDLHLLERHQAVGAGVDRVDLRRRAPAAGSS